jgi:hypothetical protein
MKLSRDFITFYKNLLQKYLKISKLESKVHEMKSQ